MISIYRKFAIVCTTSAAFHSYMPQALALENTDVLPKGVRNVTIKNANTTIEQKTVEDGSKLDLADPFRKNVTFKDVIKKEDKLKQSQIRGTMLLNGFKEEDSLGQMNAEMQGDIRVVAPIIAYGLTDTWTLAIAIPYYQAKMAVDLGFETTATANNFALSISDDLNNQVASAREAVGKLNDAEGELDKTLAKYGYENLENWQGSGIGDITLASKNMLMKRGILKIATTNGLVLPTGKTDDPDNLIDIPFGDGNWDVFTSLIVDQKIGDVTFNQYGKYVYQTEAKAEIRQKTEDEKLEVEKETMRYKLGDKMELGTSAQYSDRNGVELGTGVIWAKKLGDSFRSESQAVRDELNYRTDSVAQYGEFKIGYSTIPAFQRKTFAVPFKTNIEYKKHLASKNTITNDLVTFDIALYF